MGAEKPPSIFMPYHMMNEKAASAITTLKANHTPSGYNRTRLC